MNNNTIKILYLGDIVGKLGREVVKNWTLQLRQRLSLDFVIANGENSAAGFGITKKICEELYQAGVDVITTGNHVWDQSDLYDYIDEDNRIIRCANYPLQLPGRGYEIFALNQINILVAQVMGQVFLGSYDCPFAAMEKILYNNRLGENIQVAIVDMHGEITSEKAAMAYFLDGKVSAVLGSHTHVPTADLRILSQGTAFQTDVGMCGNYDSIIGFDQKNIIQEFRYKMRKGRRQIKNEGQATLCGVYLNINSKTGKCLEAKSVILDGKLPARFINNVPI